jgi:hypothetical protein
MSDAFPTPLLRIRLRKVIKPFTTVKTFLTPKEGYNIITSIRLMGEKEGCKEYLKDVEDGAGCAEIWERLSERRDEND